MLAAICLFLPSILGLKFLMHLNKNMNIKDMIIYYLLLVLFSNFICVGVMSIVRKLNINLIAELEAYTLTAFKYLTLGIIANLILALIFTVFIKFISFKIEVNNDKKGN